MLAMLWRALSLAAWSCMDMDGNHRVKAALPIIFRTNSDLVVNLMFQYHYTV